VEFKIQNHGPTNSVRVDRTRGENRSSDDVTRHNGGREALIFYRKVRDIAPAAFAGLSVHLEPWRAAGSLLYFSFVNLTSVGFRDIVPVHPAARGLANLEAIVSHLFSAMLLG